MKIKDGYNSQEMEIKISGNPNGSIELWIKGYFPKTVKEEILSYMSLEELASLKKECEVALRDSLNI